MRRGRAGTRRGRAGSPALTGFQEDDLVVLAELHEAVDALGELHHVLDGVGDLQRALLPHGLAALPAQQGRPLGLAATPAPGLCCHYITLAPLSPPPVPTARGREGTHVPCHPWRGVARGQLGHDPHPHILPPPPSWAFAAPKAPKDPSSSSSPSSLPHCSTQGDSGGPCRGLPWLWPWRGAGGVAVALTLLCKARTSSGE